MAASAVGDEEVAFGFQTSLRFSTTFSRLPIPSQLIALLPEKKGEALGLGVYDNMSGGENQFKTFPSAGRAAADSIAHYSLFIIHVGAKVTMPSEYQVMRSMNARYSTITESVRCSVFRGIADHRASGGP